MVKAMWRCAVLAGWVALFARAGLRAEPPMPAASRSIVAQVAAPSAPNASAPLLQRAPDGRIWLAWVQPGDGLDLELRLAELDGVLMGWRPAHRIAPVPRFTGGPAAGPALAAASGGRLAAAWMEGTGSARRVVISYSGDGGLNWSEAKPASDPGRPAYAPALAALADGRFLLAWTEADPAGPPSPASLHTRILSPNSTAAEVSFPPAAVSPPSVPALAAFPDGGAVAAYLGAEAGKTEVLRLARWHLNAWNPPERLPEGPRTLQAPAAGGAALASDGGRLAVAWVAGQGAASRVLASYSPDAGDRFLMPQRVAEGDALGRPAVVILHDGAVLVVWLSAPAAAQPARIWMRRFTPDFTMDPPRLLASLPTDPAGWPSAALVRDYAGGSESAVVMVAWASPHRRVPSLRTLKVTVPEAALLAAANDACHCAPPPEELVGYAIRGTVVSANAGAGLVRVEHDEFPGLLAAGTDTFAVSPELAGAVQPGLHFLGRIERQKGAWRLFALRKLAGG